MKKIKKKFSMKKIISLRDSGMTFKEIANKLSSNCTTIRRTYYNLKS